MDSIPVKIKRLPNFFGFPEYKTEGAVAMDLHSAEDLTLYPGTRAMVGTGIAIALPSGYEAQIRARSGCASKGVIVLNAPGTIDFDFRSELKVLLACLASITMEDYHNNYLKYAMNKVAQEIKIPQPYQICRGDRIAQMLIAPVTRVSWVECDDLDETKRGSGGFGSTGV